MGNHGLVRVQSASLHGGDLAMSKGRNSMPRPRVDQEHLRNLRALAGTVLSMVMKSQSGKNSETRERVYVVDTDMWDQIVSALRAVYPDKKIG